MMARLLLAILMMLLLVAPAQSQYSEKWVVDGGSAPFLLCDVGNTDTDPQPELLYAGCGNGEDFLCLYLIDGANGSIEWLCPEMYVPVFDGRPKVGDLNPQPWPWASGPELVDVDADGTDEIVFVRDFLDTWQAVVFDFLPAGAAPDGAGTSGTMPPTISPNPFGPSTRIDFGLEQAGPVTVSVYDVRGRLVTTLLSEPRAAGTHSVTWDGMDAGGQRVASGTYFCRIEAGSATWHEKMVFVK